MKTRVVISANVLLALAIAICGSARDANAQVGVGLRGYDGSSIYLVPTQGIDLTPYAVSCPPDPSQPCQPLPNYTINMSSGGVDNSAGHQHPHDGNYKPSGTVNPTSCTTGANGNCPSVRYTASYVGQQEWLSPFGNTLIFVVYLDILPYNPANPSNVFLTGFECCPWHPYNHQGTYTLRSGVDAVATNWYLTYGSALSVNDMALPYGGWFDLNQNWSCPHQYHGRGTAVDFNGAPPGSEQAANLTNWCSANNIGSRVAQESSPTGTVHCEASDNINPFSVNSCPTAPGLAPPGGLSSLQ